MRGSYFCALGVLGLFAVGLAMADETNGSKAKDKNNSKAPMATIAKVDSAKGTVTVTMKDQEGKEIEKTLQLAEGAQYFDGTGKAVKIATFQKGENVLITEKDGKIAELKKCQEHCPATITKVNAKKGTVSVTMKDKAGKEIDKTFQLMDDAVFFDGSGKVATIDVFESGDEVIIVETEGKLQELKKDSKGKAGDKDKAPIAKKSAQK